MFRLVRSLPCEAEPNKKHRAPWREVAVVAAGVCFWASAASADVLLFSANIKDQSFTSPAGVGTSFVDLTGSGVTKLSFTTTAPNQRVSITFSTGCIIDSGDGAVEINILVDPAGSVGEITVPPTNRAAGGSILCVANGSASDNGVAATVVASARPAQAGANTVRVRVSYFSLVGGSIGASLTGTSLTVTR